MQAADEVRKPAAKSRRQAHLRTKRTVRVRHETTRDLMARN